MIRPATKILVAGLLGRQTDKVRQLYRGREEVQLIFANSDADSRRAVKRLALQVDVAIGLTNFISHTDDRILDQYAKRYLRIAGGISKLTDAIDEAI